MKKILIAVGLFTTLVNFSQETLTNKKGSEYKFTPIKIMDATPVLNQGWTGTCWSFSALSFFETELQRLGKGEHVLSEMFVVRNAYLGKAEKFIRMQGKANFDEGGAFHDIAWVIRNHGIVPKEVYEGLNYGYDGHNHSEMAEVLRASVNAVLKTADNLKGDQHLSTAWKKAIAGILDAYLGEMPNEFKYQGKKYTPQTFADYLGLNMDDYISITSFSNHKFYEKCMLAIPDNWAWGSSYNVPLEDLWGQMKYTVENGYTFAWGADVSEKGFNYREGLAIVPADPSTIITNGRSNRNFSDAGAEKKASCFDKPMDELVITQELRQTAYDNKTTTDDHGMHATGIVKDQNGKIYFLIKNSWGTESSNYDEATQKYDGYFFASEAYMKYKTINIYIHKDALMPELKKKLNVK
ncbi:MAG: aminopeptidase [Crocinitomicaceae bacterium]|nr:aminopeptidase [Crocinitomicaceae bacterium]